MFRCLSNYSKVIKLANVRSFPTYRLVAMNSTYEANKNDTSSKRNSINDGTKYVRIAAMLITALDDG
ncbi:Uncharacterized protein BM_BM208 [Brugia malayi]|uniref:Bm208 n=1 Tax=Brugia malayi TaxID=6279 RepID=A0A4E9FRA7_BRUMA|nr:Uncharacterized protein BM_BM208 [Brugia malayi]VIO99729.1 Uncharacterized protein BM_BM208 [Brugia malayi]